MIVINNKAFGGMIGRIEHFHVDHQERINFGNVRQIFIGIDISQTIQQDAGKMILFKPK